SLSARAADQKSRLRVDDYQIEADLNPHSHKISAKAKVKFTALDDLSVATFELNNALRLTKVTDANNKPLSAERITQHSSITIPPHMVAIGSGKMTVADSAPSKKAGALPGKTYTFVSDKPSFPGTIIAGVFQESRSDDAGVDLHVFFKPLHQKLAADCTNAALKEFTYYITAFGPLPSPTLRVVELPDDTIPTAWAPEMAAMASRAITEKTNYRLLANTIAHQWWGCSVSPSSKDDWWITDGFSR